MCPVGSLFSAFVLAGLLSLKGFAADLSIEVRNGVFVRMDAVLSHVVTRAWAESAATHTLAEMDSDGQVSSVPYGIDASGEVPVLVWLLTGTTEPGAVRRFVWVPKPAAAAPAVDLRVVSDGTSISIENGYFRLKHPIRGGGGFPREIAYVKSRHTDYDLTFYDRIGMIGEQNGKFATFNARDFQDAEARVVYQSPLRVTVEARTGFGKKLGDAPGNPRAVYRYVYTAFSPVVEVSACFARDKDQPWFELYFLQPTRTERRCTAFVTGDEGAKRGLTQTYVESVSVNGRQWAVMEDVTDACGVGFDGAFCKDEGTQFIYSIRSSYAMCGVRTQRFSGGLYLGPSKKDAAWYAQWMGRGRQPEIRFFRDGKPWIPVEREALTGAFELKNKALRIVFDEAENGFDCLGIENRLVGDTRFVHQRADVPGLWRLIFKTAPDAAGQRKMVMLDNRSGGAAGVTSERVRGGFDFVWKGLPLPDEPDAVDVRAEVRLASGEGASEWRLKVANRSGKFGLWESEYPRLLGVVPAGLADAVLPDSTWGGLLQKGFSGGFEGFYPSCGCPLQMLAFNLGEAGLYFAAHDGAARTKRLMVTREQDVTIFMPAENAGVPGSAGMADFPVVVAAYRGNWWEAARRYRAWATRQVWTSKGPIRDRKDYPQRLADLGYWFRLGGAPDAITNGMAQVSRLFPDVPVGLHWYTWHQIPFDNSYPEYFPAKEGMAEATRLMTGNGVTVMPYINSRLWDQDLPSFAGAFPSACKQFPSGTNYVEHYYGKRSRNLVPMCPATRLWQDKIQEVCHRLMSECGVNGIYLDQLASSFPTLCFDPSHGHPLGGGRYWADGFRAMLTPIKAEAARTGTVLATEHTAEPYMDNIDAFLTYNPRHQDDIPLLPAVYSGYTIYFSSPQSERDSLDAFCTQQARDFLWGCQMGWDQTEQPWILQEQHREKQQFQLALCRYRLAAKAFLVYGQLVDEVRPLNNVPNVIHLWNRNVPHQARLPAVMGTVWKDRLGRLAAVIVNTSGEPQTFDFRVEPERWLRTRGPWRLTTLTPSGETPAEMGKDLRVYLRDLPPREIRVVILASQAGLSADKQE